MGKESDESLDPAGANNASRADPADAVSIPLDDEDIDVDVGYNFVAFYADEDVHVPRLDNSMLPDTVSELAATSEIHDRRFDTLGVKVTDLRDQVQHQGGVVQGLSEGFAALEDSLIAKADMAKPSRWAWQFLTQEQAEQLWQEVRWFTDQFVERYPLASDVSLPPCWYRHTLALDELTAVYAAWREAYCGTDRPSAAMAAWWDRWLWPMLHRLALHADWRDCKQSRHHIEPTARQATTDAEFSDFIKSDIARRPSKSATSLPWPIKKPRTVDN